MQTDNKFFEDLSKMLNGMAGTMAGMGREAQDSGREKLKGWLGGLDFVSRDEFEAVKAMAAAARDEVATLKAALRASTLASAMPADAPHVPTSFDAPGIGGTDAPTGT